MKREIVGTVLCGGGSRRMGRDKAELEIRPGLRQVDYLLGLLQVFCQRRALCLGPPGSKARPAPPEVGQLFDAEDAGGGPMAGVIAGLRWAEGWPVLAVACDLPFMEERHFVQLLNRRDPQGLATAFLGTDGVPEPMCAVYEPASLARLEELAAAGRGSLRDFLKGGGVERVAIDQPDFLANVNDPGALAEARRRLGSD